MWTLLTLLLIWPCFISKVSCVHISGPGELSVWSDNNVTLECVGEGVLEWLYNGSPLMGNVHTAFPRPGIVVLVLSVVTAPETGVYTCTNGTNSHSISLLVKDARNRDYSRGGEYDTVLSSVVGGVVGVGVVAIFIGLGVCVIMACVLHKEKVRYGDEMDYEIKEEYFATLNLNALEALSPEVRAHIDLDFLAQVTNTDPALLDKYKPHPQTTDEQNIGGGVESNRVSPSRISLTSVHFDVVTRPLRLSDSTPITPHRRPRLSDSTPITPHRRPTSYISTPTSPAPSMRHQIGIVDLDSSSEGEKQSFLRMLKMVESVESGGLPQDRSPKTL